MDLILSEQSPEEQLEAIEEAKQIIAEGLDLLRDEAVKALGENPSPSEMKQAEVRLGELERAMDKIEHRMRVIDRMKATATQELMGEVVGELDDDDVFEEK